MRPDHSNLDAHKANCLIVETSNHLASIPREHLDDLFEIS